MARRRILAAGLLFVLTLPAAAQEDFNETEQRLKSAGIDAALRTRIHAAIDKAAAWLVARQDDSGAWEVNGAPGFGTRGTAAALWSGGATALSGLALQRVGSPAARDAAQRALVYLLRPTRRATEASVYISGITALLCHAHDDKRHVETLTTGLARGFQRATGLWRYGTGSGPTHYATSPANLSTSQFAALGLWAGQHLGAPVPKPVWRRHLTWLLGAQHADGTWPYATPMRRNWTSVYPTGAFMGFANLMLAKAALADELAVDAPLREQVLAAESRGRAALRRFARWTLRGFEGSGGGFMSLFPFYALYALEKASIFSGRETLGATWWYRQGAQRLLALQHVDGGWHAMDWRRAGPVRLGADFHESRVLATAFGLLFLLRISDAHRPPEPERPVTGAPTIPPGPATLPTLKALLARAQARVEDPKQSNEALIEALHTMHAAYQRADAGAEALKPAVEAVLLSALRLVDVDKKRHVNRRARVVVRAAQLLADTHPRVLRSVRVFLEDDALPEKKFWVGVDVFEACFDVLARYGTVETLDWLLDDAIVVNHTMVDWLRTGTALTSLSGYHHLPLAARRAAAGRLVDKFRTLEATAHRLRHRAGVHAGGLWAMTRPDVLIGAFDLVRTTPDGPDPMFRARTPIRTLAEMTEWLAR